MAGEELNSKLTESLLREQFRALVAQRSELEKHIWQIPLGVVTGVAVMFGAASRLVAVPAYGLHALILPAVAGIAVLLYGIVMLCRMRVGRALREEQLRTILKDSGTAHYLVQSAMLNEYISRDPRLTHRLGGWSLSLLSFGLLTSIGAVLLVLLAWLCFQ